MKKSLAAVLALAACTGAGAQAIYRCGNTYTQEPCPGAAAVLQPTRAPTAGELAAARAQVDRDTRLARSMEEDRLRQEARGPRAYIPPEKAGEPESNEPQVITMRLPKKPRPKKPPAAARKRASSSR
jgi:hypothetical protein